ncbi:DUF3761 domain-containing protein [Paraburkholderia lycopersici]|uniref:DUF3761 domain-containing protein n=1 Tax=Paraburkholderia lycopersici TaxID=416944 RepID=A0A1G7BUM8_9BURK|nr:DUF3761 domain-containing protein [Paraburkholderia lycopersici]SDE30672.1 Protein of unknown function [Paraburkholderia lycopersici]
MHLPGTPHATRISRFAATLLTLLCVAAPAFAFQPTYATPDETDLDNHHSYQNRSGDTVHSPAHSRSGRVPEGASAQCRDGTYSFSRHHSGTCSRHGGVGRWL